MWSINLCKLARSMISGNKGQAPQQTLETENIFYQPSQVALDDVKISLL